MWVQTTQFTGVVHLPNKVEAAASKETTFPFLITFSPIGMLAKKSLVILPKSWSMSGPSIVMAFLTSLAMRMTNCFPISTKSMAISFPQGHQTLKLKVKLFKTLISILPFRLFWRQNSNFNFFLKVLGEKKDLNVIQQ